MTLASTRVKVATANEAAAEAVKDVDVDVVAIYPITPQTTVVEKIAEFVANGDLDAELIYVESEHSAMSALIGASACGARAFTSTSSQGLIYMHEVLHIASGMRLPLVMCVAMRALSAPISIWNDHSDLMSVRDSGWVIYVASSAQEVYDTTVMAYRLAEDPEVLLPVMVAYDGFIASHTAEPFEPAGRERALELSPKRRTWSRLDPDSPITMGTITSPEYYYEFKYQQVVAMEKALEKARELERAAQRVLGRSYGLIETYKIEDADVALLVMGSYWDNARLAVDEARRRGTRAGALRLRLYRPFPLEELERALRGVSVLGVVDRAISYGARPSGPIALEIAASIGRRLDLSLVSIVAGLGQRTVTVEDLTELAVSLENARGARDAHLVTRFYGVRGL